MRVELHPEARAEFRAAAVWYEERRTRLGDDFIAEISALLDRIAEAPGSFPLWPGVTATTPVRKATVHRFPYFIAFEVRADCAYVLAVAHARRRPLYWISRIRPSPASR